MFDLGQLGYFPVEFHRILQNESTPLRFVRTDRRILKGHLLAKVPWIEIRQMYFQETKGAHKSKSSSSHFSFNLIEDKQDYDNYSDI